MSLIVFNTLYFFLIFVVIIPIILITPVAIVSHMKGTFRERESSPFYFNISFVSSKTSRLELNLSLSLYRCP